MHPLPMGTEVGFDIAQGMNVGTGFIIDSDCQDGDWFYRIEVTSSDDAEIHLNDNGELWVCDFELTTSVQKDSQFHT